MGFREYGVFCPSRAMDEDFFRGWPFAIRYQAHPGMRPPGLARHVHELGLSLEIVLLSHRDLSLHQPWCLIDDSFFDPFSIDGGSVTLLSPIVPSGSLPFVFLRCA